MSPIAKFILIFTAIICFGIGIKGLIDFTTGIMYHYEGIVTLSYDDLKAMDLNSKSKDIISTDEDGFMNVYFDFNSSINHDVLSSIRTKLSRWSSDLVINLFMGILMPIVSCVVLGMAFWWKSDDVGFDRSKV